MKIVEVINKNEIVVEFQDEHKVKIKTTFNNFKRGSIKNPYDITVYGVGYFGEGKFKAGENAIKCKEYNSWIVLMRRCYDKEYHKVHPAYKDCYVCEEWKCFQNFAQWHENNFYNAGEGRMHIDKDILYEGNKEYSPDKCIFVPQRINMIFMERKNRKYDLPTGVSYSNNRQKYTVFYNGVYQGMYSTLEEAIEIHAKEKRKHIKQVAHEYKNRLPQKVYDALINW